MTSAIHVIEPAWPAPARVRAMTTTRAGGVSGGVYGLVNGQHGGLNLGAHCGDDPVNVAENRARLAATLPSAPTWLDQVHGVAVWSAPLATKRAQGPGFSAVPMTATDATPPVADAAVAFQPGSVLAIMTADCLPVFFCNQRGDRVGLAHAGWRGLANGVLEATLLRLKSGMSASDRWLAWLGPAIGPSAFEVGDDVRNIFCAQHQGATDAFLPAAQAGKWWADIYALARMRLQQSGVEFIGGGECCTVSQAQRFYSFRRDKQTGRMASLIWLAD